MLAGQPISGNKMSTKQEFIKTAQLYCQKTGMSRARLGAIVARDAKFFDRLTERDGDLTTGMLDRFNTFFTAWMKAPEEFDANAWAKANLPAPVPRKSRERR